jgi:choline kinase
MKIILLAAGIGQRLGDVSAKLSKCLLKFGGKTLLQRHLSILKHFDINEIIIITGYQSELVEQEITGTGADDRIRIVQNPDYRKGSIISMLIGLQALANEPDFILMDADVLYDYRILEKLLNTPHQNCFLLDREFEQGEEPVKLCVRDGQLIEFRKKIDDNLRFDYQGESVGFFRFNHATADKLIQSANTYLARGEDTQPYEECIRDLLLAEPGDFGFEDITGLEWIEIDFPEDINRANTDILPKILQLN